MKQENQHWYSSDCRELLPPKAGLSTCWSGGRRRSVSLMATAPGLALTGRPGPVAIKGTDLRLAPLQRVEFTNLRQLPSIADAYAVPTQRTFPGIDALHPSSGRMFQCTVSTEHDMKAGIFDTLERLDSSINPAPLVVVPTLGTFKKWTNGIKIPKLPPSASAKVQQHCKKLKQYVLLLESMKIDP